MDDNYENNIINMVDNYEEPEFGSIAELYLKAGYQKLNAIMKEDSDIKETIKDLIVVSIKDYLKAK